MRQRRSSCEAQKGYGMQAARKCRASCKGSSSSLVRGLVLPSELVDKRQRKRAISRPQGPPLRARSRRMVNSSLLQSRHDTASTRAAGKVAKWVTFDCFLDLAKGGQKRARQRGKNSLVFNAEIFVSR